MADMSRIDLRIMRHFVAVAEELHFGRAAARLGIQQPPLSQQIGRLERDLRVKLFRRDKRHVTLTEPGRVFLEAARTALAQAEQAVVQARRAARGEVGRLRVGLVSSAMYEDVIPRAVRNFRERHREVGLVLQEWSSTQQAGMLLAGELDVGFVRPPLEDARIALETVTREPLVMALPEMHPLARVPAVRLPLLASSAWIMLPRTLGPGFYDQVLRVCLEAGFSPAVAQEATQIHTMIGLVAAGLGVAMVPASAMNLTRRGVVYVPVRGTEAWVEIAAAYLKETASPVLEAFLAILRDTANHENDR